jgi:hypothetical protein
MGRLSFPVSLSMSNFLFSSVDTSRSVYDFVLTACIAAATYFTFFEVTGQSTGLAANPDQRPTG